MPRHLIRSPPVDRGQPLLTSKPCPAENMKKKKKGQCAEVAGGAAADCAAVCCCCPCGLMNLLILAVYKVPAGLCKRVLRKKKRERIMKKKGLLQSTSGPTACCCDESTVEMVEGVQEKVADGTTEAVDLEKEMWGRFHGAGFWRSPSQRDEC